MRKSFVFANISAPKTSSRFALSGLLFAATRRTIVSRSASAARRAGVSTAGSASLTNPPHIVASAHAASSQRARAVHTSGSAASAAAALCAFAPLHAPALTLPRRPSQMLKVTPPASEDDAEIMGCIIHAATMRIVAVDGDGLRPSMSLSQRERKITADMAHDLIKLVLVGDSGAGKTALMLACSRKHSNAVSALLAGGTF